MLRLLEAEKTGQLSDLENTPLWRIRTHLQRLMAEKMADYASFKRMQHLFLFVTKYVCVCFILI